MSRVDWTAVADTLAHAPNVVAAWAFGSARGGDVRPGGDVDVAILFGELPTLEERADLRADLQEVLGIDNIDLVTLNNASALLRFEAVSGHRILCRDAQDCAAFVSLAAREVEDANALAQRALGYWTQRGPTNP